MTIAEPPLWPLEHFNLHFSAICFSHLCSLFEYKGPESVTGPVGPFILILPWPYPPSLQRSGTEHLTRF